MKKLLVLFLVLNCVFVFGSNTIKVYDLNNVQPLTEYSFLKQTDETHVTFTKASRPLFYFNDENTLNLIETNFEDLNSEWNFEVKKGIYKIKAKNDGTFMYSRLNDSLSLKLKGIVFYNTETEERIFKATIFFSEPIKENNKLIWQLTGDSNYILYYENKLFRDVLTLGLPIKKYIRNNKPEGWNLSNTLVGLVYDLNFSGLNDLNSFESTERITFNQNGRTEFFIRKAFVESADYNFGFSGLDFNVNQHLRSIKLKKYLKERNLYLEVIDANFLWIDDSPIVFNASISTSVSSGGDDCDDKSVSLDCTDTQLELNDRAYGSGIMFRNIGIEPDSIITNAILTLNHTHKCSGSGNCHNTIYGNNRQDINAWYKPDNDILDVNNTNNAVPFNSTLDFTPNGTYKSTDFNVTLIIRELVNSPNWSYDTNIAFRIHPVSYGLGNYIYVVAFEGTDPEASLEITFVGVIDPCKPTINQNWIIDSNLTCVNKTIVVGTGNTYLDANSMFTLINSNLFLKGIFSFSLPFRFLEEETFDGNMHCDSNYQPSWSCFNAKNPLTEGAGEKTHDDWWASEATLVDHNITVDVPNKYYEYVQFPLMYSLSWATDVEIQYYNGVWNTVFHDIDFNHFECHNDFNVGNFCWCDMNIIIQDTASKFRVLWEEGSYLDGCYFSAFDGAIATGNITILNDSTVNVS